MRETLASIFWLGTKEVRSMLHDLSLLGLLIYSFTLAIYAQAQGNMGELHNAAIAIVDEDHSQLSRDIARAFLPPHFRLAVAVAPHDVDRLLDTAAFTFILDIPPHFERDAAGGRTPAVQVNVDATAAMQAGIGAGYIQQILASQITRHIARSDATPPEQVRLVTRMAYNPNVLSAWFESIMGIANNVTMLAIILAGAAVVREREHGTMDHLLVMPLTPLQIALAKIVGNGFVIAMAVALSLFLVVRLLLHVPVQGSVALFMLGVMIYLFFATAIGIFLGTVARSMPQLGLLFMLVAVPMMLLSGAHTPVESMPLLLQQLMQASPTTHFVAFAKSILLRGAGADVVWPRFLAVFGIGVLFLALALWALPADRRSEHRLMRFILAVGLALLSACTVPVVAPDAHVPPFARAPYEPFSRDAVVAIALREWRLFGSPIDADPPGYRPATPGDKPERQQGLWQRVGEYWWLAMNAGAPEAAWTGRHDASGITFPAGEDGTYAWSAAFVSYVMRMAGAGALFPYSASHSRYIDIAAAMAQGRQSRWLVIAERPEAYAPLPGDLICLGRGSARDLHYDQLPAGHFPAHCDIVVATALAGQISVVGGNVDDAVALKQVPVTPEGRLATPDGQVLDPRHAWMVVLRLNLPTPVA